MSRKYDRRKNRKGKKKAALAIGVLALLLILFSTAETVGLDFTLSDYIAQKEPAMRDERIESDLSSLHVDSTNALLIRLEDDQILLSKNSDVRTYPASLTKMMTALVVIERAGNLNEKIVLDQSIFDQLISENASMAGFRSGEKITIRDLLYGVLLPSGAEACLGLAEYLAGSEAEFVELMNEKADFLGMENTNFMNTTGLHDPEHFTTAEDMAKLLSYALKNRTFENILTAKEYTVRENQADSKGHTLNSTLFMKLESYNRKRLNGEILGGKTGYTGEAGLCLASFARIGGQKYMLITMGASGNLNTEQFNITDAIEVYSRIS